MSNLDIYDEKHWEILIETIVDRIGVERFLATAACVLGRKVTDMTEFERIFEKIFDEHNG